MLLGFLVIYATLGGLLTPWHWSDQDFLALTERPSGRHLMGTNQGGGDVLAQTVVGLRRSLMIGLSVSCMTTLISAMVGAFAAYFGGWIERLALALIHFLLIVPSFLVLALVSNRVGGDWLVLVFALALFGWMIAARGVWSMSTSLRERDYILAAEFMGVPKWRIVLRHILPHLSSLLVVNFSLGVTAAVLAETSLSFLGFGVKPPDVSLGSMLADGAGVISSASWLFAFPAAFLLLFTMSMTLIADGVRDALDPVSAEASRR
ncbi:ABC transporter permease [Lentzea waywayandensis]